MSELKKVSSNIIYLFFDKAYGAFISILFLSALTRYLGPELFGVWSYVLSFASIAVPLSTLGTNYTVVKRFSSTCDHNSVFNQAFIARLIASVATSVLMVFVFFVVNNYKADNEELLMLFVFLAAIMINNLNISVLYNEHKLKNGYTVLARNIGLTAGIAIKLLLIYKGAKISQIAMVTVLESVIFLLISHYSTRLPVLIDFSMKEIKKTQKLINESFPLFLSSVVVILYLKIDIILLKHLRSIEEVGHYAAATRISEMLYAAPVALSTVFFPLILKEAKKETPLITNRIRLYAIVFYSCIFLSISCSFLSPLIINSVYGPNFVNSVEIFSIHCFSIIFIGFLTSSSKELIAKNQYKFIFYRDLAGLICNVILNIIFIPKYGVQAAALTTLFSYFVASVFSNLFFPQTRQVLYLMLKAPLIFFKNTYDSENN